MTSTTQAEDFDIAKGIFDKLKDLPADRQRKVLRWIAEGLALEPVRGPEGQVGTSGMAHRLVAPPVTSPPGATGTDIRSFITAKAPKSDNQFAAAVAYFYRFEAPPEQRRAAIDGDALQEAARLAGRKRLGNPRATLNNAKAVGYLDSPSPGEFAINSVGENLVAMTLPGGTEAPARKRRSKKASGKKGGAGKRR